MDAELGQTVLVFKAGNQEPYVGIVVKENGVMPTVCILPNETDYGFPAERSVMVVSQVPPKSDGWGNGWMPLP